MNIIEIIDAIGTGVEAAGVVVLLAGAILATLRAANSVLRKKSAYHAYRRDLGRSILLGLELLVAGDIIRTVAVTPTFTSVGVLAVIVLIRTFLSFALEVEITGRWPWQKQPVSSPGEVREPEV